MFKSIFTRISLMAVVFIAACTFVASANALELTDGVETGMSSVQEVEEQIDLKPHVDRDDLTIYQRVHQDNAFYAFNTTTDELVYKIVFYSEGSWNSLMDKFTARLGEPNKSRSSNGVMTYFWAANDEAGIKMSNNPDFEGVFQLWYGSIPLWNEFTTYVDGFREFPE